MIDQKNNLSNLKSGLNILKHKFVACEGDSISTKARKFLNRWVNKSDYNLIKKTSTDLGQSLADSFNVPKGTSLSSRTATLVEDLQNIIDQVSNEVSLRPSEDDFQGEWGGDASDKELARDPLSLSTTDEVSSIPGKIKHAYDKIELLRERHGPSTSLPSSKEQEHDAEILNQFNQRLQELEADVNKNPVSRQTRNELIELFEAINNFKPQVAPKPMR